MPISRKFAVAAGAAAVVVAAGAGAAAASGGSDEDPGGRGAAAITGDALQKATDAALAETGGGRVTGTEVADEDSYYEVEVTRDDGSQVDVQLDENFAVVGTDRDKEDPGEGPG